MKIRYGAWVDLPGISTKEVAQIREAKFDSHSLYLFTVNYNNDKKKEDGLKSRPLIFCVVIEITC